MWSPRVSAMFLFLAVSILFLATSAAAQSDEASKGVRAGVSGDPGQFYVGAHLDLKQITDRIWFRPSAEVGNGDGLTLVQLNGEVVYFPKGRSRDWTPFVGGGPSAVGRLFRSGQGDSGIGPGFNFLGGIQERRGLLVEIKIGAFDSPGFKAGVGWTW